jgi:orotate phosphoribosyltransferase
MSLFKSGTFVLHSGQHTDWIIDCAALTDESIQTLAHIAVKMLPPFGTVQPVMRGGLRFATALAKYSQEGGRLLIAEDVVTTSNSMEELRDGRDALGICMFARGPVPPWVKAVWHLGG